MAFWKAKFRDDQGRLHMELVEADNREEAQVFAEMLTGGRDIEELQMIDETKLPSPLTVSTRPLKGKDLEWAKQVADDYCNGKYEA